MASMSRGTVRAVRLLLGVSIPAAIVAVLSSCGSGGAAAAKGPQFIVPKPADNMVLVSTTAETAGSAKATDQHPAVKVPLTPDYIVEQVINTNLDTDDMDEQIIVYKRRAPGKQDASRLVAPPAGASTGASSSGDDGSTASGGKSVNDTASTGGSGSGAGGASDAIGQELMVPVNPGAYGTDGGSTARPPVTGSPAGGIDGAAPARSGAPVTGAPGDAAGAGSVYAANNAGSLGGGAPLISASEAAAYSDNIWLMVADFDPARNSYVVSWEGPTGATNPRTVTVYAEDLTGDHNLEIVARGINAQGEQTLDVFRRTVPFVGTGLRYQNILSITSDGNIEIQESDRSEAYHSGSEQAGRSFPISTLTRDTSADNPLDMVRTTYAFNNRQGRYEKSASEKVPGDRVEASQLATLYNGTAQDFEAFLNGPWYQADDSGSQGAPSPSVNVLFFNAASQTMEFSSGDVQEAFTIQESYKTAYQRGILLKLQNEAIPTLTSNGSISVPATDTIVVQGAGVWDGTYKKLSSGLNQTLFGRGQNAVTLSSVQLSGLYRDDNGDELFFSPPRFTLRHGADEQSGGYVLYQYDQQKVLELRTVTDMSRFTSRKVYLVDYSETVGKTQTVRTLKLTPAVVSVKGVEPLNNDTLRYEQIIRKDQAGTPPAAGTSNS